MVETLLTEFLRASLTAYTNSKFNFGSSKNAKSLIASTKSIDLVCYNLSFKESKVFQGFKRERRKKGGKELDKEKLTLKVVHIFA